MAAVEIGTLVADSGAFIKHAPLQKWSPNVVTVKEVLAELRDEHTRRKLLVLPYEVNTREPSPSSIQYVTAFAKKTGDYGSLSPVDLKVMALAHQLLCEQDPEKVSQLKAAPVKEMPTAERVNLPGMVGFYKKGISSNSKKEHTEEGKEVFESLENGNGEDVCENVEKLADEGSDGEREDVKEELGGEVGGHVIMATEGGSCGDDDEEEEEEGEEEEDGWITPDNLAQAHEEMGGVTEEEARGLAVACVTTDFAMQNVLLQIGIPVLSVDGMRIKQLRTYAKKCKACFKTTTNTSLLFCPNCGNKTLAKVSVTVDQNGALRYQFLGQKQFSHRGLRFSLPQPKGGRHANNPVLAPDQKVTQKQRRSRNAAGLNPLHPDYIAQTSPFSMKDVTSRGAQISFQAGRPRLGGGRRNPNAVGPKRK